MTLDFARLLPPPKLALLQRVASLSAELRLPVYLVGGFVRDLLLKQPVNDFDFVVEGDAIHLARALAKAEGGRTLAHFKFGTAVLTLPDGSTFDFISARSETYSQPGALPTVKFSSIEDDLRRRDFTINAMAVRLDGDPLGALIDPLEGQADLQRGLIRVLHPHSFVDDPTRILRAARYAVRYGFTLEERTFRLVNAVACQVLAGLSGARLRHEFELIFAEQYASVVLARLREMKVLTFVQPALNTLTEPLPPLMEPPREWGDFPFPEMLTMRQCLGWLTWLAPLPKTELALLTERLDFPATRTRSALAASALLLDLPSLAESKPSQWTFHLDGLPALAVYAVYLRTQSSALKEYLANWRHIHSRTTGDDLKALGLPPGPQYKEILTRLRAAWLDGEVKNEEEEKSLLEATMRRL